MYKISSTGAVMNKRTLKILKHFLYETPLMKCKAPCVTLYRAKVGMVLPVQELLDEHFPGAKMLEPTYKRHKTYAKKGEESVDLFLED